MALFGGFEFSFSFGFFFRLDGFDKLNEKRNEKWVARILY